MKAEKLEVFAKEFAKTNKIAVAKVMEFAATVADMYRPKGGGRQPSVETANLRKSLEDAAVSGKLPKQFTVKELITIVGGDAGKINNTIRYLVEQKNLFERVGSKPKAAGEKGKPEIIWAVKG